MPTSALTAAILLALLLTGCSDIKDAATDKANQTACSVAQKTVDTVADQADNAIDEIGADPQAAEEKLSALRGVLDKAQAGISGDAKDKLREAADALGRLADEAGDAAKGAEVDTSAVGDAQDAFGDAVDGVRDFC